MNLEQAQEMVRGKPIAVYPTGLFVFMSTKKWIVLEHVQDDYINIAYSKYQFKITSKSSFEADIETIEDRYDEEHEADEWCDECDCGIDYCQCEY